MTDTFTTPDDDGPIKASDFAVSGPEQLGNRVAQGFHDNSLPQLYRAAREAHAGGEDLAVGQNGEIDAFGNVPLEQQQDVIDQQKAAIPDISKDDARALLKQEGLSESDVPLGNADSHKLPVLQLRIADAHGQRDRAAAIDRGPQGLFPTALGYVTSLGVGMIDPVNIAAFSIPVIGEARYGKILASAGESILGRTAIHAAKGAVQGAVGTAALQPFDWWLHTRDGRDYTMAEALSSVVMGAGMGAAFHALPSVYKDWRTRRQGLPLEGTALDRVLREMPQQPEPEATPASANSVPEEVPGITSDTGRPADVSQTQAEPPQAPQVQSEGESGVPNGGEVPNPVNGAGPVENAGVPRPQRTIGEQRDIPHPGEVLADLPPGVRQDAVHAAMAAVIEGKPVQSAEMLDIAADHDPRIAETIDPWNAAGEAARAEPLTPQAARQAVHDDIRQKLISAGVPEDEADANAAVAAARYNARAERLGTGQSALDLYRGEGLEVKAPPATSGETPSARLRQHGIPESAGEILSSHADDKTIKVHADYTAAKAGDDAAADRLVEATVDPKTVDQARERFGPEAIYAPVIAEEATGHNAIPVHLAQHYAAGAGGRVSTDIQQTNRAFHTGAGPMERLAHPARFGGQVVPGGQYVLVDDVSVMGSTLASMADHIRNGGGEVKGVITLANASRTGMVKPKASDIADIERRYGHDVRDLFGIEPAALTGDEARYIRNFRDADSLRASVASSEGKRLARFRAKGLGEPESNVAGRAFNQPRPLEPGLFADREAEGQTTLPGAERITPAELAQRKSNEALKPKVAQKPLDVGLFGDDAAQKSFFQSHPTAPTFYSVTERAITSAKHEPVHAVDITPELRKAAVEQGFPLFQGGENPRGRITLADNRAIVELFRSRDASTFMHESGHLWLDELMRDAAHPQASEQLRADRATVLDWLGVKDASEIGTAEHEKWAEGFERYLASGEAPSSALKRAFEAFKTWLGQIYRSLSNAGEPVPPEIRGVMDRMLATEGEIKDLTDEKSATTKAVKKTARGRAAADPQTWSLFEYLASKGGLKPDPELAAIFGGKRGPMIGGFGPLLRHAGMPLDEALRVAKEGHYLFDNADVEGGEASLTPRDLLDMVDRESRGEKAYRLDHITPDREISRDEEAHQIVGALHTELEAASGQKGIEIDPRLEARVVEIIQREGEHDVLSAYERAIMEDEERYEAVANARAQSESPADQSVPGWDVPDDARTAQERRAAVAPGGGPAERAGPADRGGIGEPARTAGPGDRAPRQAQLKSTPAQAAADPRWRALADTKADYDDPETLAESEAAEKLPEPDSVQDPKKSLTALEKAAADAEEVWRQLEPTLTETERSVVNDVMDQLKLDADTRAKIISDGAACLAGAIG